MQEVQVGNSRYIRDLNLTGIFRLIQKYGPISRKELAENTGYSAATITNHVKRLMDEGFVIETNKGSSTGGRRPVYLTVNPDQGYILAVDIEVNQIRILLFDLNLKIKEKLELAIGGRTAEEVLLVLVDQIKSFCQQNNIKADKIIGVGVVLPGLVDNKNGYLHFAPNLKWRDIDIKGFFEKKLGYKIVVENEAKAAVLGEKELVFPDVENMVYVSINEGIGCGIIFNGNLYRGASGNAGEFGHIIIDSNGPECHCGNYGCWETLASTKYISSRYFAETGRLLAYSDLSRQELDSDKIFQEIVKETARNIAIGLVNIINSLSPDVLVIGGNILTLEKYIMGDIEEVLAEKALSVLKQKVELACSKLGNKAALYGIARMVFDINIEEEIIGRIN
ncbi:MAG TPA: ROK family protein [Halanaerobiaceae bacterium]|jgi:predicted NBD/HSP70 family sugar kinase|nr:ROK family transcriptional regulator [Bacillota bacterium]HHU92759.1 ROK family protein [Halanaerobiaceae bacterium]HOA41741.1 ROK family transcriptional regulator [Halanaerobiales bacterium]HPZ62915.1 ROK family transcriptional regulator [Halanaerobiales bacterium]HQD04086.1 ROK family transcriptional regulator [Halanaerobiales bacterium]